MSVKLSDDVDLGQSNVERCQSLGDAEDWLRSWEETVVLGVGNGASFADRIVAS